LLSTLVRIPFGHVEPRESLSLPLRPPSTFPLLPSGSIIPPPSRPPPLPPSLPPSPVVQEELGLPVDGDGEKTMRFSISLDRVGPPKKVGREGGREGGRKGGREGGREGGRGAGAIAYIASFVDVLFRTLDSLAPTMTSLPHSLPPSLPPFLHPGRVPDALFYRQRSAVSS
jgi:hypothetical protein